MTTEPGIGSDLGSEPAALRISDADRNGTLRRLHNAVALGLIDIDEFEERSAPVSQARLHSELDALVERSARPRRDRHLRDRPGRTARRAGLAEAPRGVDRADPAGVVRRMGSVDLDLTRARFAGPDRRDRTRPEVRSVDIRLPDGASASIDDVEVVVGSARDHRQDAPAEGTPHVILTGKVVCGSVDIRGPRRGLVEAPRYAA